MERLVKSFDGWVVLLEGDHLKEVLFPMIEEPAGL
jgi:hypothetical protein